MSQETCNLNSLTTTLDALLRFVNQRCHVVREARDMSREEEQSRNELLERYLWEHRELIADYVQANPDHLPVDMLQIARDLTGTLYGTLYLEHCEDSRATFLHETGVYHVVLPTDSLASRLPEGLLELRGALAPYQGRIVLIPPLSFMGRVGHEALNCLHARLARAGTDRPTHSGDVLAHRAKVWHAQRTAKNARATPLPIDALGQGYHRGVLAGLNPEQRKQACQEHASQLARESGLCDRVVEAVRLDVDSFPITLEDALETLDTDWLNSIACQLGDETPTSDFSRKQAVQWICSHVANRTDLAESALMWCLDEQFKLIGLLLDTNPLPLEQLDPVVVQHLYPIVPYVFILREGATTLAWMPPEVRALITHETYETAMDVRKRLDEVRGSARMLATMCGVVSVSDVYERYRRLSEKPLDRRHFERALEELQTCDMRDDYALWRHHSVDYVISTEISDESAPARVTRECYADHVVDPKATGFPTNPLVVGLSEQDEHTFMRKVAQREEELERERVSLLMHDRKMAPPRLDAAMLAERPIETLMNYPQLQALRSFVDAHVPDGEDDYEFADVFVRSVVASVVLMAESYNDTMDLIRLYQMEHCDGTEYSDTLGRLVTNAYNELPRWELNGWSLEQCTERLTGKRRFYNPDGTVRAIDDDDPCPCGSGKRYASCCGHLL